MENEGQIAASVTQNILEVPGARLYYEIKGEGPLLLMIPGANGDHFIYSPIREIISKFFTVATYDRRGFSGSELTAQQDYTHRINTDADDAATLIKHLSKKPATVFASSSGGLLSMQLMIRHSELIKALVLHEPTAFKVMPDPEHWKNFTQDLYDIYKSEGPAPAMEKFVKELIPGTKDGEIMKQNKDPESPNVKYWFEHELRQYPNTDFDIAALAENKAKIIFAIGSDTAGMIPAQPNTILAKQFGTKILTVPGGHLGYLLHPAEFANCLINGLNERGLLDN